VRQMSFSLTTEQILARTKTVTRRLGWADLKPSTLLQAVEKSQGLKKGERVRKLCVIRVVSVRREPLSAISCSAMLYRKNGTIEASREGFPGITGAEFVERFCRGMRCEPYREVTRIEFEHVQEACLA